MSDVQAVAGKKRSKKKIVFIVIGVVVALVVAINVFGGGGDGADVAAEAPAASAAATATAQEASADESTEAAADEPAAEDTGFYVESFGTFEPVSEKGKGDAIVMLPAGATAGTVTATHKGSANFAIAVLDDANQSTGELLVNEIGSYRGTTAWGLSALGDGVKLEVTADGAWTLDIAPMDQAPLLAVPANGAGDAVLRYDGPAADWTVEHKGKANFVIYQTADFMPNLAVNEIGRYSGVVPMQAGPSVVTVKADGKWSIS